jgi:acetolactate synthase I/II/III large subunit
MHFYDALADAFIAEDVNQVFGLLGDGNMHWSSAMSDKGVDFFYSRHEHCAVSMAMGYARAKDKIGVATVTCGPGLTQTMTALTTAARAKIPLVVFVGESPLKANWYNQELEQAPFVNACGVEYYSIRHPKKLFHTVREVFFKARTKQIPIVLGVPFDLQESEYLEDAKPLPSSSLNWDLQRPGPDPKYLHNALEIIKSAKKPIIIGGLGAIKSKAKESIVKLADKIGALLATTLPARGLFEDHDFSLNVAGGFSSDIARECFLQSDLIIAVGTSLASHAADAGKLYPNAKVMHIDLEPKPINHGRVASHCWVQGDALTTINQILETINNNQNYKELNTHQDWRSDKLKDAINNLPEDKEQFEEKEGYLDPRKFIKELDSVLPKDLFMVNSSGHCSYFSAHMKGRSHENFLTIREFGAIGNGLSYSIGAAIAEKDKQIVLIDGDGGFIMHVQELESVIRHKLKVLFIVLNDEAYGSEIHKLRQDGISEKGAVFGPSSLSSIAKGFGLESKKITKVSELQKAYNEFTKSSTSVLWDVLISDKVLSPAMRRLVSSKKNT